MRAPARSGSLQRRAHRWFIYNASWLFFALAALLSERKRAAKEEDGKMSGLRVLNFGMSGDGPNRMLRMLMFHLSLPSMIIYVAIQDHIRCAAGLVTSSVGTPHYEDEAGTARYVGLMAKQS